AGDRHARAGRGSAGERAAGAPSALGRALRRQGDRARRARPRRGDGRFDPAHRPGARLRAGVGGDRLPGRDRAPGEGAQPRVPAGARGVFDGAPPPRLRRLGPGRRPLARGLSHRWRRRPRTASSLSHDGVAGRGTAQRPAGRRDAIFAALREGLEEELFAARRDLLTTLDIVFMDTTSLYFEGAGGQTLGRRGFSKDHRPDLNQMILAVLLDGDGRPVCTEMWPGNTADVTSLIPAIDRLQRRFRINRVCVVADRGMISAETIAELEARKLLYVLGVRERTDK